MKKCNVCHVLKIEQNFTRREKEFKNCNDCYQKLKKYKEINKEKIQKEKQNYYTKNKTKIKKQRELKKIEIQKKAKEYYLKNKTIIKNKKAIHDQKNKVLKFIKKNNLPIEYKEHFEQLLQTNNCPICGVVFEYGKDNCWNSSSFDHIVPQNNNLKNFQIICSKCNRIKSDLTLDELRLLSEDKLQITINQNSNILNELKISISRFNHIYKFKKSNAKKRNIEFLLTKEDLLNMLIKKCPIFNVELNYNGGKQKFNTFSIDRINNNENYNKYNCRIICHKANCAKWKASKNDVKKIYEYMVNLEKNIIK
jgi:5-methylcytosine-specific restriction endonuclease McrA